ncbi:hypothetical protein [Psychrobium sp. 1_MG-2023]|uniref:hypothetical protein n=1 Tax=Psychrobium sp. 1_MG-2023 TaxID=3062624 RepID=UPI000C32E803|nr:hypothetical protein [Psychrobium sp. 1_MG-2023]MDP2560160.1 hypothetical protein [Psychrobium sp. 1_MG-2023]PKF56972.1 hypothetical protein CW748_07705 [Alteromonadales bacterium alter-6D02]
MDNLSHHEFHREIVVFKFFSPAPIIEPDVSDWIFRQYEQLFHALGKEAFINSTELILPTNDYFPAKATSANELAYESFKAVQQHLGLAAWPLDLVIVPKPTGLTLPQLEFNQALYGKECVVKTNYSENNRIAIPLTPQSFGSAQTAVANIVMSLCASVYYYAPIELEQTTESAQIELLATFMGFGLMLANTTYQFRGGCGSCYNPQANRHNSLSENEMVFSLALFCQLKGIPERKVLSFLKAYLKSPYKKSVKLIKQSEQFHSLVQQLN